MAQFAFDATNVAPQESIAPIPAGVYLAQATESDVVATRSGGQMIKLTFEILQGPYARRKVWGNISVRNPNADSERIGQSQLSALCHAIGMPRGVQRDTAELHMKPVMIRVKIRKDDTGQYGDRNEVNGYEAAQVSGIPVAAAQPAAAPAAFAAPVAAAQPAAAPAAFAAPAAAAASAAAPWARRGAAQGA